MNIELSQEAKERLNMVKNSLSKIKNELEILKELGVDFEYALNSDRLLKSISNDYENAFEKFDLMHDLVL
jgi:hypothetical protein